MREDLLRAVRTNHEQPAVDVWDPDALLAVGVQHRDPTGLHGSRRLNWRQPSAANVQQPPGLAIVDKDTAMRIGCDAVDIVERGRFDKRFARRAQRREQERVPLIRRRVARIELDRANRVESAPRNGTCAAAASGASGKLHELVDRANPDLACRRDIDARHQPEVRDLRDAAGSQPAQPL